MRLSFESPLLRARRDADPAVAERYRRRRRLVAAAGATLLAIIVLFWLEQLCGPGLDVYPLYLLYWAHDFLYLPAKAYTFTLQYPWSWIWWGSLIAISLFVASEFARAASKARWLHLERTQRAVVDRARSASLRTWLQLLYQLLGRTEPPHLELVLEDQLARQPLRTGRQVASSDGERYSALEALRSLALLRAEVALDRLEGREGLTHAAGGLCEWMVWSALGYGGRSGSRGLELVEPADARSQLEELRPVRELVAGLVRGLETEEHASPGGALRDLLDELSAALEARVEILRVVHPGGRGRPLDGVFRRLRGRHGKRLFAHQLADPALLTRLSKAAPDPESREALCRRAQDACNKHASALELLTAGFSARSRAAGDAQRVLTGHPPTRHERGARQRLARIGVLGRADWRLHEGLCLMAAFLSGRPELAVGWLHTVENLRFAYGAPSGTGASPLDTAARAIARGNEGLPSRTAWLASDLLLHWDPKRQEREDELARLRSATPPGEATSVTQEFEELHDVDPIDEGLIGVAGQFGGRP